MSASSAPAPLDVRLFQWWQRLPAGRAVSMDEMLVAMSISDPQAIRSSLTRLRRGIRFRGVRFSPLTVRWNPSDRFYYNLGALTDDVVEAQVPGDIIGRALGDLQSRIASLDLALGQNGVAAAAALLSDAGTRSLLAQIPLTVAFELATRFQIVAQARQLLEIQSMLGTPPALPPATDPQQQ